MYVVLKNECFRSVIYIVDQYYVIVLIETAFNCIISKITFYDSNKTKILYKYFSWNNYINNSK